MTITSKNVFLLGDTHANWDLTNKVLQNTPDGSLILQLGDFGFWPGSTHWPPQLNLGARQLMFLAGNHEKHCDLPTEMEEVYPGVTFLPRGTLLDVNGVSILAFGGADTVSWDRSHRIPGVSWFAEEVITLEQVDEFLEKGLDADIVISHTSPMKFAIPGIKPDLYEDSRINLNKLLEKVRPMNWAFGHFHLSATGEVWQPAEYDELCCADYVTEWVALNIMELVDITWLVSKISQLKQNMKTKGRF